MFSRNEISPLPAAADTRASIAKLEKLNTPPRASMTWGQMWQGVGQAIADAAREVFSGPEHHISFRGSSEGHNGGRLEDLRIVVSEIGAARLLGAELPWSSKLPFFEISLHVGDSPRYPMQVGALGFRTTDSDGKLVAELIAGKVSELVAERGLERLAPSGEHRFEVVRKL